MESAELQLTFFGGLTVSRGSQPVVELTSQKALALLCYLALTRKPHSRLFLAGLLWGDMPEDQALMNLRKALNQLRQQVGDHLSISRQQVGFNYAAPHRIDVITFTSIGQPLSPVEDLAGPQLARLEQAIALYQGDFLEGFYLHSAPDFEQWVLGKRAYYHELALELLVVVASEHSRQGRIKSAIEYTRQMLRLEPWRESSHRVLMQLLAEDGQRGAALAQYGTCRRILLEELGVEPSEATESLYRAIQTGEIGPRPRPPASRQAIKPQPPSFLDPVNQGGEISRAAFVGRENHLAWLAEQLATARNGQAKIVFVSAEAGMGKTSLLAEFSRRAQEQYQDLIVASGICTTYTGKGDPYLPWREILRMLACDLEIKWASGEIGREHALRIWRQLPIVVAALVSRGRNLLDTFVPGEGLLGRCAAHEAVRSELIQQLQDLLTLRQDAGVNQERIFEEYTEVLTQVSRQASLLLILDDLHWADASSLNLLFHLGRRLGGFPVLIVAAYRPEEFYLGRERQENPLESVLAEFKRLFGDIELQLDQGWFSKDRQFVDALLDTEPNQLGDDFRAQLTYNTRGHPLFTVEMLREMQERGDISQDESGRWQASANIAWDSLPRRVEGVIEKRLNRLEPHLLDLLVTASVEGEDFSAEVIAQVCKLDLQTVINHLSADLARGHHLVRARGVEQADHQRISRYQFNHNLFQKYLYSTLDSVERVHLHRAIGEALEDLYRTRTEVIAVHLARHFQEARLGMKASEYLLVAGQQAASVLAFDEAVMHCERGISELANLALTPQVHQLQYELSLALAQALWHSGRVKQAVSVYQDLIEIARALKDPQALARAALAYEEPRWRLGIDSQLTFDFLRESLAAIGEEQSGLRVRLLVNLSRTLLASGEHEELRTTVEQALQLARQFEDPLALCDALRIKAQIDRRPETTNARLAAIQEMMATAELIADKERLADALDLYVYDLLELGQIERADEMIAAQRKLAQEIKQPFQLHIAAVFETMRAIMRGEFEAAERLAHEAGDLSRELGLAEMDGIFGIHMFTIRREQGRLNEIAPLVKLVLAQSPETSAWRPGLALIYGVLGLEDDCRAIFEGLAAEGFSFVPQDSLWVATMAYLSEVCAILGDLDRADILYENLLPYNGRTVVVGGATACYGAVARFLGILATTRSDWEAAERHFREAIELDERMEAWPWLAHSQCAYAAMLLEKGGQQDCKRAYSLLEEALRAAQKMGMAYLAQKVAVLQALR